MSSALRLWIIIVVLLAATALGVIAYNMNMPRTPVAAITPAKAPAGPATATTGYFVAARPLTKGTLVRAEDFTVRPAPIASIPAGAILDTPDAKASLPGSLVRAFIDAGHPVTLQDILRPHDRGFLASVLAPGSRAISIKVDSETGDAGLIRPGDLVDVVLTQVSDKAAPLHRAVSETVLHKVPVIAIDQDIAQGGAIDQSAVTEKKAAHGATAAKLAQTVSLELTPEQVNKITVAKQLGKLSLAVRAATDQDDAAKADATSGCDVSPTLARQSAQLAQLATVTIYSGSSKPDRAIQHYTVQRQDADIDGTKAGCDVAPAMPLEAAASPDDVPQIDGGTVMAMAVVTPPEEAASAVARNRIVCFVEDELSAAALRKGLEGSNLSIRRGTVRHATRMLETDTDLFTLVADISGIDDPFAELERLASVCPPDVQVVLIGDNREILFYRELMEIGVTEYLPKPITRDMVLDQLRPKLLGNAAADPIDRGGHVVSICGAQGGAGATSIAINLALQLAETTKAKVALLDLHLQGGETAVMLGVRPGPGLRIALENPMRADTLFLERAAIDINDRVCLISGDEDLDAHLNITEAGVRHVLGLLRQRFNYVVVDVPVPFPTSIYPVITLSRHVLVLLEAEVTGLRNAHALRTAVTNIAGKDRVFTLLNRANRAGGLPRATIVKALGAEPDMIIPDLGKGMTQAVNLGIPALKHVSGLRRHLAPIVREITGIDPGWKGRWRRLLRR